MHERIINYYHQTMMLSTLINFSDCNRKQRTTKYIILCVLLVGLPLSILFWIAWRWEKYKKRGWIVLAFSSFFPIEVTNQKQLDYSFWRDVQILTVADKNREREKKDTKQLYMFLPQTGSSLVPLALLRRVHSNVISDYKWSLLKLARDFKLLKHNNKRFPMLLNTIKRLLCSSTTARDF